MDVVVQRVYQTLFREQATDGGSVFRDAEAEAAASKTYTIRAEKRREQIMAGIMRKHQDESKAHNAKVASAGRGRGRGGGGPRGPTDMDSLDDEGLYAAVNDSSDPDAVVRMLTQEQQRRLHRAMEQRQQEISFEIQQALEGDMHSAVREVTQLFRVHLSDASVASSADFSNSQDACVMTVWGCNDDVRRTFAEGKRLHIFNVHGAMRSSGISCFNYRRDSQVETVAPSTQPQHGQKVPSAVGFIPRSPVPLSQLSERGAGAQVDFSGVVLSLSAGATELLRAKGRVFVLDHTQTVVCLQTWQLFQDAKRLGAARGAKPARQKVTTVEVRDAFYGGRDSWSGGTHLTYCTEDTSVVFKQVLPNGGAAASSLCRPYHGRGGGGGGCGGGSKQRMESESEFERWLASPAASTMIDIMEAQLSACLSTEQPQFATSLGGDGGGGGSEMESGAGTIMIDRGTVEVSGCLLANRCRPESLQACETAMSTQTTDGRRLHVASADGGSAAAAAGQRTVTAEAHISISSLGEAGVRGAVVDHSALLMMLGIAGVSKEPAATLLLNAHEPADGGTCIDRMVWRLVRDGVCGGVGHDALRYLPAAVIPHRQQQTVTPQLRGQLALHRAQTLQRHVAMSACSSDRIAAAALLLESAIVVSAPQALECLTRMASAPEQSCILPFLPDEWAWVCGQLNADLGRRRMNILLQRAAWEHHNHAADDGSGAGSGPIVNDGSGGMMCWVAKSIEGVESAVTASHDVPMQIKQLLRG